MPRIPHPQSPRGSADGFCRRQQPCKFTLGWRLRRGSGRPKARSATITIVRGCAPLESTRRRPDRASLVSPPLFPTAKAAIWTPAGLGYSKTNPTPILTEISCCLQDFAQLSAYADLPRTPAHVRLEGPA